MGVLTEIMRRHSAERMEQYRQSIGQAEKMMEFAWNQPTPDPRVDPEAYQKALDERNKATQTYLQTVQKGPQSPSPTGGLLNFFSNLVHHHGTQQGQQLQAQAATPPSPQEKAAQVGGNLQTGISAASGGPIGTSAPPAPLVPQPSNPFEQGASPAMTRGLESAPPAPPPAAGSAPSGNGVNAMAGAGAAPNFTAALNSIPRFLMRSPEEAKAAQALAATQATADASKAFYGKMAEESQAQGLTDPTTLAEIRTAQLGVGPKITRPWFPSARPSSQAPVRMTPELIQQYPNSYQTNVQFAPNDYGLPVFMGPNIVGYTKTLEPTVAGPTTVNPDTGQVMANRVFKFQLPGVPQFIEGQVPGLIRREENTSDTSSTGHLVTTPGGVKEVQTHAGKQHKVTRGPAFNKPTPLPNAAPASGGAPATNSGLPNATPSSAPSTPLPMPNANPPGVRDTGVHNITETTTPERRMYEAAPSVIELIQDARNAMQQVSQGPLASRWQELWSGKFGADDPAFRNLSTVIDILSSRFTQMHQGNRPAEATAQRFLNQLGSGHQSAANMTAALGAMERYANRIVAEGRRKGFGTPSGGAPVPGAMPNSLAQPKTKAEFDALPKGSHYIDPQDGKEYRKP
jgi:hypothetical protein